MVVVVATLIFFQYQDVIWYDMSSDQLKCIYHLFESN